jgi:hypothetical protein
MERHRKFSKTNRPYEVRKDAVSCGVTYNGGRPVEKQVMKDVRQGDVELHVGDGNAE